MSQAFYAGSRGTAPKTYSAPKKITPAFSSSSVEPPDSLVSSYGSAFGGTTAVPDGNGGTYVLSFSWLGDATVFHTGTGGFVADTYVHTDPGYSTAVRSDGTIERWNYDAAGYLISHGREYADGSSVSEYFDKSGARTGSSSASPDQAGVVWTENFDSDENLVSRSRTETSGLSVRTDTYDAQGVLTGYTWKKSNVQGNSVTATYDAAGNLLGYSTTIATGLAEVTITNYSATGTRTGIMLIAKNASDKISTSTYDPNGNLIDSTVATVQATGSSITGTYNSLGVLTSYVSVNNTPEGKASVTTYTDLGVKLREGIQEVNGRLVNTVFEKDGRIVMTTRQVDGSRAVRVDDGNGYITTTSYAADGGMTVEEWSRLDGRSGTNVFSADGSTTGTIRSANGAYSSFVADGSGNVETTHFAADGVTLLGRNVRSSDDGRTITTYFDADGNLIRDVWIESSGATGRDIYAADGTITGECENGDGTYSTYMDDGHGTVRTSKYGASGDLTDYIVVADDGTGLVKTTRYDPDGHILDERWLASDGRSGATLARAGGLTELVATYAHADALLFGTHTVIDANGSVVDAWATVAGRAPSEIRLSRADGMSPDDLIVGVVGSSNTLSIPGYFSDGTHRIRRLVFADGTIWGEAELEAAGDPNSAPVLMQAIDAQFATEDVAFSFGLPSGTFIDSDIGDTLAYEVHLSGGGSLPSWLTFDSATQTFGGTPTNDHVGSLSICVSATDNAGEQAVGTFALTVTNTNDAPIIGAGAQDQAAIEDSSFVYTLPPSAFIDVDLGDSLTYSAALEDGRELPSWLQFAPSTRTFFGTPTNDDVGDLRLNVIATDLAGLSAESRFVVSVANTNDAPVVTADSASINEDCLTSISGNVLANDADVDRDAVLAVVNPTTLGGMYGHLTLSADGSYQYAFDDGGALQRLGAGATVNDTFTYEVSDGVVAVPAVLDITVVGENDAPNRAIALGDVFLDRRATFSWQVPPGTFVDVDADDPLSYSAEMADGTELPAWLSFDGATQTFSGHVPANQKGMFDIRVTATDGYGAQSVASDVFRLSVDNGNEGVGNGDDLPPPGHAYDYNDGSGTSPGNPGSRVVHADNEPEKRQADGTAGSAGLLQAKARYLSKEDFDRTYSELDVDQGKDDHTAYVGRWIEVDLAVSRWMAAQAKSLGEYMGADVSALHGATSGFLGSTTAYGPDPLNLAAGADLHLRTFQGLSEGLHRL